MSVKIMSLVFDAIIPDLAYTKGGKEYIAKASTVKLLLLAYADHSNDEGAAAYPGYTRLEDKTGLSRQGISNTLEAVRQNGFMKIEGKSRRLTNSYQIDIDRLSALVKPLDQSSHLTRGSQVALPAPVKSLDLNRTPTIPKPSDDEVSSPSPLYPSTQFQKILIGRVTAEIGAKHKGGKVVKFPSLACKAKFEKSESRLGDRMDEAINRAMEVGATTVSRAVDYISKWAPAPARVAKIANGTVPGKPSASTTPIVAPDNWHE